MSERRAPPSPLPAASPAAGAGGERSEPGEGLPHTPTSRARALRTNLTDAERKLWRAPRDRRLGGTKFRRQAPIGPYIADFICYEARLVIEVDGGQHADSPSDRRRDQWLAVNDGLVLRFWNSDVLK